MFKSNTPFAPKNLPFYYGWVIVPAAIVGLFMSLPGQTAGFSAFTDPLIKSLGISRSTLAFSYFLGTIASGFTLPKAGKLLDKYGTRPTTCCVAICLGIVLIIFSYCESIIGTLTRNLSFIPPKILITIILAFLFLSLRFFGQGMLPMISNTMVGRWFDKKRGRVVAIMGMINSLVFNAAPYILSLMVTTYSWQYTWRYFAIIIAVFFLIFSWVFFRDNPESCHLPVDGILIDKSQETSVEMTGSTIEMAQKTLTFKIIALALSLYAMTLTGLTFHLQAIGTEAGLDQGSAMAIFVPVSFITIPVGFITAWLSDRFALKRLIFILAFCQTAAALSVAFLHTSTGYYSAVIFLGLCGGMFGPLLTIAFPWFFGRLHLGAINGKVTSYLVIFSALGPLIFSTFKDLTGSFSNALYFFAILPAIICLFCKKISTEKIY